jgi:hypothetical protein
LTRLKDDRRRVVVIVSLALMAFQWAAAGAQGTQQPVSFEALPWEIGSELIAGSLVTGSW